MEGLLSREQATEVRRIVARGNHLEEGIVSWCFENIDAHREQDRGDWTFLTYEELVQKPVEVCRILGATLDLPDISLSIAGAAAPATNIGMSDKSTQKVIAEGYGDERVRYLVSRWRNKVSELEESAYFSIIDVFGIDFYSFGHDSAKVDYLLASDDS